MARRDWGTAEIELRSALDDPNVRTIAQNRLDDLKHRRVYGCQKSHLYHRASCPASHGAIERPSWFEFWRDAERDGRVPCPQCKPQRIFEDLVLR